MSLSFGSLAAKKAPGAALLSVRLSLPLREVSRGYSRLFSSSWMVQIAHGSRHSPASPGSQSTCKHELEHAIAFTLSPSSC